MRDTHLIDCHAMSEFFQPKSLDEALSALAETSFIPVAGGTDYYPPIAGRIVDDPILDLSRITSLRGIEETGTGWRIGATTTWSDICNTKLPPLFDCLKLAAKEIGGRQIQNMGTIAGNICNASPAADGVPVLMALEAQVELASMGSVRSIPIDKFIIGNRRTAKNPSELVTSIYIPKPQPKHSSTFLKLGARRYLVISIAMIAIALETDSKKEITSCRIAVGACSPVAQRLKELEEEIIGSKIGTSLSKVPIQSHFSNLSPIDDIRSTATYRMEAAFTLVCRALDKVESALSK
jgi:CO/xanthine dehydrogenase FAD-binding subunit